MPTNLSRGRVILLFLLATAAPLPAHDRGTSYSTWEIDGPRATVRLRFADADLVRLPWAVEAGTDLPTRLTERLRLRAVDETCKPTAPTRELTATPGQRLFEWNVECPAADRLSIDAAALFDQSAGSLHFARIRQGGREAVEHMLSTEVLRASLEEVGGDSPSTIFEYVVAGIEHILDGTDHLAFLLALLTGGAASLGAIVKVVTGFTVAHSLTLGLASLGTLRPQRGAVEALIGLSIAFVAAENLWLRSGRRGKLPGLIVTLLWALAIAAALGVGQVPALTLCGLAVFAACYYGLLARASRPELFRWALALVFGLVHGFGFAAVLDVAGLPPERLWRALLGFNLGVEIGQLVFVALALAIGRALQAMVFDRRPLTGSRAAEATSAVLVALGVFWLVSRGFG